MKNIKVYGNEQCPDCSALKKELSDKEIKFEFINIIESLENLKNFYTFVITMKTYLMIVN